MGRHLALLFLFALLLPPATARAQDGLVTSERGRVVEVVDGDTLVLDDGLVVRLVGIQAPKLPLGRDGFRAWPLADEARAALAALTLEQRVVLSYGGQRRDRYDRALAHLHLDDGRWVQGVLLRDGWARVYSFRDNRAAVAEMLALEQQARAGRRGIWRLDWYRVRTPEETDRDVGSFQLVAGRVRSVAVVRGRLYLNYGEDWRSDFTVSVAPRDVKTFDRAGFPYAKLEGQPIRVRGWIRRYNGPLIEATHPEQIELLSVVEPRG